MSTERTTQSHPHNPRMHVGGKLSFRRRVRSASATDEDDAGAICGGEDPPALAELVPEGCEHVEIEVGPGKGAFLIAATEAKPDAFLLGIEAAPAYAHHAAGRLSKTDRQNGLFLIDNAKLYLQDRVEPGSVRVLHVYFPDPWPKRRHRGRRFFTEDVPPVLARVLEPAGFVLAATDNAAYAGQICRVMGHSVDFARDEGEERRLQEAPPGHGFSPTNFERKYAEEGRTIRRYAFRKVAPGGGS